MWQNSLFKNTQCYYSRWPTCI